MFIRQSCYGDGRSVKFDRSGGAPRCPNLAFNSLIQGSISVLNIPSVPLSLSSSVVVQVACFAFTEAFESPVPLLVIPTHSQFFEMDAIKKVGWPMR